MAVPYENEYWCCQMFPTLCAFYFMAVHLMFHGIYGILIVASSFYRTKHLATNYCAISSSTLFIAMGILVLWTALYSSWKGSRLCACLTSVATLFNLSTFILYFVTYVQFDANSLMDVNLFWRNHTDWVRQGEVPFTFWHLFTLCLIGTTLIGWYYSFILCKFSKILRHNALGEEQHTSYLEEDK